MNMKKRPFYNFVKRTFDIFSSFVGLLLIWWLLLILAIIVKCSSKGPVFFKDKRVGRLGKTIYVLKFRTMYADAESNIDKYLTPEQKLIWETERKLDNDPRITKIGRFLRKTSLDELPQLINIFNGTMSVVGPRPITTKELEENYTLDDQKLLVSVRPGLISNWGVNGRNNVVFETGERQKLELEYFKKMGLFYDLKLLFKSIFVVLKREGAK